MKERPKKTVALIGGGPAALFILKHLAEKNAQISDIFIFERHGRLGVGMPYGAFGANEEHVANISAKEIPALAERFTTYISKYPTDNFQNFFKNNSLNEYKVIPRLLLGNYLEHEFSIYVKKLQSKGISVHIHLETNVIDIAPDENGFIIYTENAKFSSEIVVLCTGHSWPKKYEGKVFGWYDSPYPPSKFTEITNFPVAVRGASLTAVDAVKTLARLNGTFTENPDGNLEYVIGEQSPNFSIDLFSLRGFLPALRFHSEDEVYSENWVMTKEEIEDYKAKHGGFVDLDYVFKLKFKERIREKDPQFYEKIKELSIEEFCEEMLKIRKELGSFLLLKAEYDEAEKSMRRRQSVVWKETLSAFSYAVNYPAKHFSAEDMLRLRKKLMPLISVIIASLPQSSYQEMMALHNAGRLNSIAAGEKSAVKPGENGGAVYEFTNENGERVTKNYEYFIDAVGQRPMEFNDLPFESLKDENIVSTGFLYFKDENEGRQMYEKGAKNVKKDSAGRFYMQVKGLEINDDFQIMDIYSAVKKNLFIMSVPFIGGLNPDYSGLDFCDTASARIVEKIISDRG